MSTEQPAHSIHWLSNKGCAGKPDIIAFFNIAYTVLQVKNKRHISLSLAKYLRRANFSTMPNT